MIQGATCVRGAEKGVFAQAGPRETAEKDLRKKVKDSGLLRFDWLIEMRNVESQNERSIVSENGKRRSKDTPLLVPSRAGCFTITATAAVAVAVVHATGSRPIVRTYTMDSLYLILFASERLDGAAQDRYACAVIYSSS